MDVNVRDFGAIGDDTHDDTIAFYNALTAIRGGGTCFVPYGAYKIHPYGIGLRGMPPPPPPHPINGPPILTDNMHLVGLPNVEGSNPMLRVHDHAHATILLCSGSDWSVEHIDFDMIHNYGDSTTIPVWPDAPMGTVQIQSPVPGTGPIAVANGGNTVPSRWLISYCNFVDAGHNNIVARGQHFEISNCTVVCNYGTNLGAHPIHEGFNLVAGSYGGVSVNASYGKLLNNTLSGVGLSISGDHHLVQGNTVHQAGYGSSYFMQSDRHTHDNTLIGNLATFAREGFDDSQSPKVNLDGTPYKGIGQPYVKFNLFFQVTGYEIWGENTLLLRNTASDNAGGGFAIGSRNGIVTFNRAIDNGRDVGHPSHVHASGFNGRSLVKGDTTRNASAAVLLGNIAHDTRPDGQKTQQYGFEMESHLVHGVEAGAVKYVRNMTIAGNIFHGNELGDGTYGKVQPNVGALVGRDLLNNLQSESQRQTLISLLDTDKFTIQDDWYVTLNQILFGASDPRP